jgi:GNAT superfamily N-acetyltransferase
MGGPREKRMAVRDATDADAETIADLLAELGYATPVGSVRERLQSLSDADRVVVSGEPVHGFISLHRVPRFAEGGCLMRITALVVRADARGRGAGVALISAAEEVARGWGCSHVEITSGRRAERDAAHALYRSLGYEDLSSGSARYTKPLR